MKKPSQEELDKITTGVQAGLEAAFGPSVSRLTTKVAAELLANAFFSEKQDIHLVVKGEPTAKL